MKSQPLEMQFKDTKLFSKFASNHLKVPDWDCIFQSIIEAHGGRIWPENNIGRGSTFIFTLPLVNGD
jgi:light-regulated signal transduction histidine kinase (bacteriophytochrome)